MLREPYVGVLAKRLRECLAKAQAAAGQAGPPARAFGPSPSPPAKSFATDALAAGEEDDITWRVVVNHEGQHALWPAGRPAAPGWTFLGRSGTRDECLAFVKEVWTDLRPLSLQKAQRDAGAVVPAQQFLPPLPAGARRSPAGQTRERQS
jgi:MbtH protein